MGSVVLVFFLLLLIILPLPYLALSHGVQLFEAGPSRRSLACDRPQVGPDQECVCLGTENGRNEMVVANGLGHYLRLKKSYQGCRRIVGNLEITHIDRREVAKAERQNGTTDNDTDYRTFSKINAFNFLEQLEEITGYLLLFDVKVPELSLPSLKVIWGERLYEGNALMVDKTSLTLLNLPSLRSIEQGNVTIRDSPTLCSMYPKKNRVDYSEILSYDTDIRLHYSGSASKKCKAAKPCASECKKRKCFGPKPGQCQTIYRKECKDCESKSCFTDQQGIRRCCDASCTAGCTGEGRDKCVACKAFKQDGFCVSECDGTHRYNPSKLRREELPPEKRRFAFGRHCLPECPSGTLVDDQHCVSRCSAGKHRLIGQRRCVPCSGGICPRVCQLEEPLNSENIIQLANCSEIEGNIEILGHVYEKHSPMAANSASGGGPPTSAAFPLRGLPRQVAPLNASQLDILRSVKIVTGYVAVDGSRKDSDRMPRSLDFLEGLELIEGRRLYFDKYSLYVIGNPKLSWLGLRSLRRIDHGMLSVVGNHNLCYGYTINMTHLGINQSRWVDNKAPEECEKEKRICDSACEAQVGCWGPGRRQCVRCQHFSMEDGECVAECPVDSHFLAPASPSLCFRCHEQCVGCSGPLPTDCSHCRHFELWLSSPLSPLSHPLAANSPGALRKCVAHCPNDTTFARDNHCEPCHAACQTGCTGPEPRIGLGGCHQCMFAKESGPGQLTCLPGEEPVNSVCGRRNGLGPDHFLALSPTNASKFFCQKCPPECLACSTNSASIRDGCQCAFWALASWMAQPGDDPGECALECGKGSRVLLPRNESAEDSQLGVGLCQLCHPFCDPHFSCSGVGPIHCERCARGGLTLENGTVLCVDSCPPELAHPDEDGICQAVDRERLRQRRLAKIVGAILVALLVFGAIFALLLLLLAHYRKEYVKEVQMHLPEIPPLDPLKVTQRPNMRRLNLIQVNELDFVPGKSTVLGQGAFGIVYAGKWRPPSARAVNIPVAIKAISVSESRHLSEHEMLQEAGLMHSVQHKHLVPVAGICLGGGGIKIVTLLRPLGSLLRFFDQYAAELGSKHLMLYCYQISSAMEYLANKGIVHRDLAARNVLVKSALHVEVTDFGLATLLQRPGDSVVVQGRVAVKWLAPESLRWQLYNQRTDVWSFGVTCWEVLTLGQSPYKDLGLSRDRMAHELAERLDKGYRLPQPPNCSQELYQALLNCWLPDPESRPSFRHIREHFKQFCSAPHVYVQGRRATERMESIGSQQQRAIIERLLKDSDFLDPVNVDPDEYRRAGEAQPSPAETQLTDCFFSSAEMSPTMPPSKPSSGGGGIRHGSTGTTSTRYKSDPVGNKRGPMDEANYLMPGQGPEEEQEEEEEEEEGNLLYTPVVDGNAKVYGEEPSGLAYVQQYANGRDYVNEGRVKKPPGYVNTEENEKGLAADDGAEQRETAI